MSLRFVFLVPALTLLPVALLPAGTRQKEAAASRTIDGSALAGRALLTADDLNGLKFSSAFEPRLQGTDLESHRKALAGLDVGVWVSRAAYREGEPIPVLFVVRSDRPRGLDMRITLSTEEPAQYNGARIQLERTDAGVSWQPSVSHVFACGGPPLTTIDGGPGYHCVGGDLRNLNGRHLPPGKYRLSWAYNGLRSGAVEFAVEAELGYAPPPALARADRELSTFFTLIGGKLDAVTLPDGGQHVHLKGNRARPRQLSTLASSLASGVHGRYYPDLQRLSAVENGIEASARFLGKGKGGLPSALEVTLRRATNHGPLRLESDFHVGVLIRPHPGKAVTMKADAVGREAESGRDRMHRPGWMVDRPLTLRVELPADWARDVPFRGAAQVAVILSSDHIAERGGLERVMHATRVGANGVERWRGVVRTPWLEVDMP